MTEFLDWADTKHRPRDFDSIIGNHYSVRRLKKYSKTGNFPHLLFVGPPGVGKTCCAEILAKECGAEFNEWNASDNRRLKDIRENVLPYVSTVSLFAPFKIAFMDEGDYMDYLAQPALRRIMEVYSKTCRFIISVNYMYGLIYPLRSRCFPIRFNKLSKEEVLEGMIPVVEAEDLYDIITEDQAMTIAKLSDGDLRIAIKTLQALCEGRDDPVEDEEIASLTPQVDVKEIDTMLRMAFEQEYVEAMSKFLEIAERHQFRDILKAIEDTLIYNRNFSTEEKARIASGLARMAGSSKEDKRAVYGLLSYLGGLEW